MSGTGTFEVSKETREKHAEMEKNFGKTTEEDKKGLLGSDIRAKYKIEITFEKGRTMKGPNLLGIQVWESGKRFHGGGDDLAFFCLNEEGDAGCGGVITSDCIKGDIAMCPHCNRGIKSEALTNILVGRVTSQNLAKKVEKLFHQLNDSADIYLKYHKTDVRYIAMERAKGPDVAKRLKGMHIYLLKAIIADTSHGASLIGRIQAFLTS